MASVPAFSPSRCRAYRPAIPSGLLTWCPPLFAKPSDAVYPQEDVLQTGKRVGFVMRRLAFISRAVAEAACARVEGDLADGCHYRNQNN